MLQSLRIRNLALLEEVELEFEAGFTAVTGETGAGKSYLIPALEIPSFLLLLNGYDRLAYPNAEEGGQKVYSSNLSTFRDHLLHGPWVVDQDAFAVNQFGHPYQGSMYYGFARSAGARPSPRRRASRPAISSSTRNATSPGLGRRAWISPRASLLCWPT